MFTQNQAGSNFNVSEFPKVSLHKSWYFLFAKMSSIISRDLLQAMYIRTLSSPNSIRRGIRGLRTVIGYESFRKLILTYCGLTYSYYYCSHSLSMQIWSEILRFQPPPQDVDFHGMASCAIPQKARCKILPTHNRTWGWEMNFLNTKGRWPSAAMIRSPTFLIVIGPVHCQCVIRRRRCKTSVKNFLRSSTVLTIFSFFFQIFESVVQIFNAEEIDWLGKPASVTYVKLHYKGIE